MAKKSPAVPPYGPAIQQAIASGELALMKSVAAAAEEHLKQYGDVKSALAQLKLEIARLERKG